MSRPMTLIFKMILMFSFSIKILAFDLEILYTNDWQSRLLGYGPNSEYRPFDSQDHTKGGVSRLASLIDHLRAEKGHEKVLLLDGGDFTMGTLFHMVAEETGTELVLMAMLGYDAVALGNHEFDFGPEGLGRIINAAKANSPVPLPPILCANMQLSESDPRDAALRQLKAEGIIKPYHIVQKGDYKIGIVGLMGFDAAEVAPNAVPVRFTSPIEAGKRVVAHLREKEKVDYIIFLSHGGLLGKVKNKWKGEDIKLAKKVKGIDIIVGGHSHTPVFEPIKVKKTIVLQAGSELEYLGQLSLQLRGKHRYQIKSQRLIPIDSKYLGKPEIEDVVIGAKKLINENVLKPYNLSFDLPIVKIDRDLTPGQHDHILGNFVSESIRKAAEAQIGFFANGTLRDTLRKGQSGIQAVSDVFRVTPLGVSPITGLSGYPIIKFHLTGKEIKDVLEILSFAYEMKGDNYFPRFSGVKFHINQNRLPLDRIYKIAIRNKMGNLETIDVDDEKKLFSLATTSYIGQFIGVIPDLSFGLFNVVPKDAEGKKIDNIFDAIIRHPLSTRENGEIPTWHAVLLHIRQLKKDFNDEDLPSIATQLRFNTSPMIYERDFSPEGMFQYATWIQYLCTLLFLGLCYMIFVLLRKFHRRFYVRSL